MTKLSDRIRSNSEAAPWVVEEIKKLELELDRTKAANKAYRDTLDKLYPWKQ